MPISPVPPKGRKDRSSVSRSIGVCCYLVCQALRTRIGQGSAYVPKLGVPVQIQGGDRYGQPRSWLWGRGRAWCTLMEIPGSSPRMTPERNIRRQVYLLLMRMWLAQATALSIELMPDVPARLRHDNRGRC